MSTTRRQLVTGPAPATTPAPVQPRRLPAEPAHAGDDQAAAAPTPGAGHPPRTRHPKPRLNPNPLTPWPRAGQDR